MDLLLQQIANALVLGGAYLMVAVGLYLIFSVLHIPNFAHGEMFAIGAYLQYFLTVQLGLPFVLGIPIAMVGVGLLGIFLERTVFRRLTRYDLLAVLIGALALAIVLQEVIALIWGSTPLSVPTPVSGVVTLGPVRMGTYRLIVVGVVLLSTAAVAWLVYRSSYGRTLRALAQNREVAELAGVDVARVGTIAFALGSALAGLAGSLLSATASLDPLMGFHPLLVSFVILVIVGQGARVGTVVAMGLLVAVAETLVAGYVANALRTAVIFVALVLFLMVRPEGAIRLVTNERAQL